MNLYFTRFPNDYRLRLGRTVWSFDLADECSELYTCWSNDVDIQYQRHKSSDIQINTSWLMIFNRKNDRSHVNMSQSIIEKKSASSFPFPLLVSYISSSLPSSQIIFTLKKNEILLALICLARRHWSALDLFKHHKSVTHWTSPEHHSSFVNIFSHRNSKKNCDQNK